MKRFLSFFLLAATLAVAAPVNVQRIGGTGGDANDVTTSLAVPTGKTLKVADAPSASTDVANKASVDAAVLVETTRATTAEALKAPLASPTFTGTVSGITKTMVGLGNVDNTSDANKPVSTATQTALGYFNVKSYGALGDGSTDDTAAIQAALDAGAGRFVYVPASSGAYRISDRLIIKSGTTLELDTNATIKSLATAQVCMIRNENMMTDAPYTDTGITLRGGSWDYNFRGGNVAYSPTDKTDPLIGARGTFCFIGVQNLTVENVRVYDSNGFGIQILGSHWRAENIFFDDCHKDGMHISKSDNFVIRNVRGTLGDDIVALNAVDWVTSTPKAGPITNGVIENITSIGNPGFSTVKFLSGGENGASIKHVSVRGVKSDSQVEFYLTQDTDLETPEHTYGGLGLIEDVNIFDVQAETSLHVALGNNIKNLVIQGVVAKAQATDMIENLGVNAQGNTCSTEFFTARDFVISPVTSGHVLFVPRTSSTMKNVSLLDWSVHQTSGTVSPVSNVYGSVVNFSVSGLKFLSDVSMDYGIVNIDDGTVTNLTISDSQLKAPSSSNSAVVYMLNSGAVTNLSLNTNDIDGFNQVFYSVDTTGSVNLTASANNIKNTTSAFKFGATANVIFTGNKISSIGSVFARATTSSSAVSITSAGNQADSSLILYKDAGSIRWNGSDLAVTKASLTPSTWDTILSTTGGEGVQIWDGSAWGAWGHGPAAAGTLTGSTLASGVTTSSLTSVGTLTGLTLSGNAVFSDAGEGVTFNGGGIVTGGFGSVSLAASGVNQPITLTPSGTGGVLAQVNQNALTQLNVVNTTSGAASRVAVTLSTDVYNIFSADAFSSSFSSTGSDDAASSSRFLCVGSGGMSFRASDTDGTIRFYTGSAERFRILSNSQGGELLVGTTTDNNNGRIQIGDHTASTGGIGFGSDVSLYRSAAGTLKTDGAFIASSLTGPLTGNASTATALATPRTINGVSFDGTANITVPPPTSYTAVAAGTAYTLTGSFANVDFGTTDPTITISNAGNYLLTVDCSSSLNAATTVSGQSVEIILRRTNNTPADIGTVRYQPLPASTLGTADGPSVSISSFPYTASAGDIVTVQAKITGTLGAGSVTITDAHIVAVPR